MVFELLRYHLHWMGLSKWNSKSEGTSSAITSNCVHLGIFLFYLASSMWVLLFEAETFKEFAEIFVFIMSAVFQILWYSYFLWQSQNYDSVFDELDKIIGNLRNSQSIDCNYNEVEHLRFFYRKPNYCVQINLSGNQYQNKCDYEMAVSFHIHVDIVSVLISCSDVIFPVLFIGRFQRFVLSNLSGAVR